MSKTIKSMILREYKDRLDGFNDAALISIRGVAGTDVTKMRSDLRKKNIKVTVVQNALASKAMQGTGLEGLEPLMKGASALAYGGQSVVEVARELIEALKAFPQLELKGAILDGTLFEGEKGVKELSKFPTRDEAIGQAVTLILGPAKKLLAQVKGPGSTVAGIIKSIEEKLEKGEAMTKIAG